MKSHEKVFRIAKISVSQYKKVSKMGNLLFKLIGKSSKTPSKEDFQETVDYGHNNGIAYVDSTMQEVVLEASVPSGTTPDPATSAEQFDTHSTENGSTFMDPNFEHEQMPFHDELDETVPLPRESDPKWRIFRFSEMKGTVSYSFF